MNKIQYAETLLSSVLTFLVEKKYLTFGQILLVVSGNLMTFENVKAANWQYLPGITAGVQYTDNLYFTTIDKVSDTNLLIIPAFALRGESDRSRASVEAGLRVERYDRVKEADRNDPYINSDWEHNWERNSLGIGIRYAQASTRTSELETSGRTNIFGTRTDTSIAPRWQSIVDENNTFELSFRLLDVFYDLPTFTDFQDYSATLRWAHDMGPLNTFYFTTTGNSYKTELIEFDYNYGQLLLGMSHMGSERLRYDMSLGAGYADRRTQQDYKTWLVNVGLTSEREYDVTTLSLTSQLVPSGSIELRKVYALDLRYRREVTENLNFTFDTRVTISDPVRELELERNENLLVRPGATYRLGEAWLMEIWYQYRSNRYIGSDTTLEDSVYLGFRYDTNL